jgi:hypothetical protein
MLSPKSTRCATRTHLGHLFRYLPQQSGYDKRPRAATELIKTVIRVPAIDTTLWTDDVWVVDSTPVDTPRPGCWSASCDVYSL